MIGRQHFVIKEGLPLFPQPAGSRQPEKDLIFVSPISLEVGNAAYLR